MLEEDGFEVDDDVLLDTCENAGVTLMVLGVGQSWSPRASPAETTSQLNENQVCKFYILDVFQCVN